ncbi:pentapeptide repeat-containing protein [Leptolyngbya ectocarpi]|uniref:pentapeptide repeat-containing protein n=1 Tax=Leptolyngbya ectocarpi TaxID=1202 RepID=UPI001D144C65|nr:pentapeptide repeat-containing protein [Leptolyngbya ectocarpi]
MLWNKWRQQNLLVKPDLTNLEFDRKSLQGVNLSRANLTGANLSGVDLWKANLVLANLTNADLSKARLRDANLIRANLSGARLQEVNLLGANLIDSQLRDADFNKADLSLAHFQGANLDGASLVQANVIETDLRFANLSRSNLSGVTMFHTQALGTRFENVVFTGARIQDWNINSDTRFDGAVCEFVYLKANQKERRPRKGSFKPGEFTALFQQAIDTVDLIFQDGIDWQAFFQSFQELRCQYAGHDLAIQAIERKQSGAFVVRLEVSEDVDRLSFEGDAKQLYEKRLRALEVQYERQLRLQGQQQWDEMKRLIEAERREKATLMGVLTTMANNQGPKYDLSNAQFAGGFAETVQGHLFGGNIKNEATTTFSLAEAAAEIQKLLKQLKASNPTPTEAQQMAFLNAVIPPTRRERFVSALKSGSSAAIDEVPYGSVLKALVQGWQNPLLPS